MSKLQEILKRCRAERGLTQEQAAAAIGVSASLIGSFESGRMIPLPDTAANLDNFYGTGDEIQQAAVEAREARRPIWFRPWREIEDRAATLRYFQLSLVPGLLQTEEYARSVLDSGLRDIEEIEEETASRMARQAAILDRENPPVCVFILDAAVLRGGDPAVMKPQLLHLVDVGERPNVFIHVIPETAGLHPGRSGAFALATLETGGLVGYMEDFLEGRVINEPARVTGMDGVWQAISAVALPCDMSRDLILKMVDDR